MNSTGLFSKFSYLLLFIFFYLSNSAQTYNWISTWDPGGTLSYHSSVLDAQGNIYIGYYSWDESNQVNRLGIVKHNNQGGLVWDITVVNSGYSAKMKLCFSPSEKIYAWINDIIYVYELDGTLLRSFSAAYSNPQNIFVNDNDEVIITFFGVQHDGGDQGFGAAKFNAAGLLLWDDVYRDVTPNLGYFVDSEIDDEGNIYLAGIDNFYAVVIMAGSNGLKIWENQIYNYAHINDFELGYDNNIYIAGRTYSTNVMSATRLNSDGTFGWTKEYSASQGNGEYMKLLKSNSGVYAAGYHGVQNVGNILVVRHYSANGDLLLDYEQESPSVVPQISFYEANYGLGLVYNGNIYVGCVFTLNNDFYYGLVKIDSRGNVAGSSYVPGTNYGFSCLTFDTYLSGGAITQTCIEPLENWSDQYQLKIINYPTTITSIENNNSVNLDFSLSQNYPNPFNPLTIIEYSIASDAYVNLTVHDMLGQNVGTLVNEIKNAGSHKVEFDASNLASGIYFYRIKSRGYLSTKKMLLIK